MTKFTHKINLKGTLAFMAFLFISISTFGQTAKQDSLSTPDVYLSRAPVSELSGHELLQQTWFWALIVVVAVVFLCALLSAKTKDQHEPHAL